MKIYVGNLSFDATEDELRTEFSAFGKVESVAIITDKIQRKVQGVCVCRNAIGIRGASGHCRPERKDPERSDAYNQRRATSHG